MVAAGGQGEQLVSILGGDAGVIEGRLLHQRQILLKPLLLPQVAVLIVGKGPLGALGGRLGLKGGQHLIASLLLQGVELDHGMLLPKSLIGVGED